MSSNSETTKKIWVFLGLGYTHLLALKRFADSPPPDVQIVIVCEKNQRPHSPMFTSFMAGFYRAEEIYISVDAVIEKLGAELINASGVDLNAEKKKLKLSNDKTISYDLLSIDVDPEPDFKTFIGAREFAHFMYPMDSYQKDVLDFCDGLRGKKKLTIVQIGAGTTGVESALALLQRLKTYGAEVTVHLVESEQRILGAHNAKVADALSQVLIEHRVELHLGQKVKEITAKEVILDDGTAIKADFTTICVPPVAPTWYAKTGLQLKFGFFVANQHLQTSSSSIFAVGESAISEERPWPRTLAAAIKQAPVLAYNMRSSLTGQPMKRFRGVKSYLSLIIDGEGRAIGSRGSLYFPRSGLMWAWKDSMNRKFLRIFAPSGSAKPVESTKSKVQ
jgi:selenide,water dikinase